ncbi:hypothetical protein ACSQ67_000822 [Phaseolus vulgaris]
MSRAASTQPIQPLATSQSVGDRSEKVIVEQWNAEGSNKKARIVGKYEGWEVNQTTWRYVEENLKNEISLSFYSDFDVTIVQVVVLHPIIDLSGVDPRKVTVDGKIVDEE